MRILIPILFLFVFSCDELDSLLGDDDTSCDPIGAECDNGDVGLWGECYSIETTTELDLSYDNLSGSIPSDIGLLTNLTHLNLSTNILTGQIPTEIGNLINLITLDLSANKNAFGDNIGLTGGIPKEIGNLTNLISLKLNNNSLGCYETWNGDFCNEECEFNGCSNEIPPEIGNLTNLTELHLAYNFLGGLAPDLICNSYVFSSSGVGHNNFCHPYPDCFNYYDIDSQDTSNCP